MSLCKNVRRIYDIFIIYDIKLYRIHKQYHTVNSERATNKRIFSIPALSKENTQRTFHLKPTLPISNFRQNEPLVFCHYPLEMVIFESLQSLSSEVAASDFRDSSIQVRYRNLLVRRRIESPPS